ncbi:MAG: glyoxalase [Crocinitomicaceae bacterium]|nr:glyoxalase [Crocinitomicaceae bacterium]|tara:strand:- start:273 stop:698 length:426 start_codon:yes stop_codon:yes gene_type:complete
MAKKVTGIGGIFFKSEDPKKSREWYKEHLGLSTNEYGSLFEFRKADDPTDPAYLQWSPFEQSTKYFEPSKKEFMINFRVDNLLELKKELEAQGVTICDEIEEYEYGKFLHIMDHEGNKIELWEPIDNAFTQQLAEQGGTTK